MNYSIEWCLSLINKYSVLTLENESLTKSMMLFIIHVHHRPGIHQDTLADMFKMNRSSVTRSIKKLIDQGHMTKEVDPSNKKAYLLYLTSDGTQIYHKIIDEIDQWTSMLTDNLSLEEKKTLVILLKKMTMNACQHHQDHDLARIIERSISC